MVEQQQDVRVCVYPLNVFFASSSSGGLHQQKCRQQKGLHLLQKRCTLLSLIWQTYLPFCTHFKDKLYFDKLYRMKAIYWIGKIMFTTHCQCSLYIKGLCICNNALQSLLCATIFFWLIRQPCLICQLFFTIIAIRASSIELTLQCPKKSCILASVLQFQNCLPFKLYNQPL